MGNRRRAALAGGHFFGSNFNAAELMQYRSPVGLGPSSNTWPRCASHRPQRISVTGPKIEASPRSAMFSRATGSQNEGQPVPESNFVSEAKRSAPQQTQRYVPRS